MRALVAWHGMHCAYGIAQQDHKPGRSPCNIPVRACMHACMHACKVHNRPLLGLTASGAHQSPHGYLPVCVPPGVPAWPWAWSCGLLALPLQRSLPCVPAPQLALHA